MARTRKTAAKPPHRPSAGKRPSGRWEWPPCRLQRWPARAQGRPDLHPRSHRGNPGRIPVPHAFPAHRPRSGPPPGSSQHMRQPYAARPLPSSCRCHSWHSFTEIPCTQRVSKPAPASRNGHRNHNALQWRRVRASPAPAPARFLGPHLGSARRRNTRNSPARPAPAAT